jgi:hypothetical protein
VPFPVSVVEVEHGTGLAGEVGVARKHPAPSAPRPQRVLVKPTPDCDPADLGYDAGGQHITTQLSAAEARERQPQPGGQLTRQCLHLGDDARGKKQRDDLCGDAPPTPPGVLGRSASAICSRPAAACRGAPRSPCSPTHRQRAG